MFYQTFCNLFIFICRYFFTSLYIILTSVVCIHPVFPSVSRSMVWCTLWIMLKCSCKLKNSSGSISKSSSGPPYFSTFLDSMQLFLSRKVSLRNFSSLFICRFFYKYYGGGGYGGNYGGNIKLYLFYSAIFLDKSSSLRSNLVHQVP